MDSSPTGPRISEVHIAACVLLDTFAFLRMAFRWTLIVASATTQGNECH